MVHSPGNRPRSFRPGGTMDLALSSAVLHIESEPIHRRGFAKQTLAAHPFSSHHHLSFAHPSLDASTRLHRHIRSQQYRGRRHRPHTRHPLAQRASARLALVYAQRAQCARIRRLRCWRNSNCSSWSVQRLFISGGELHC